MIQLKGRQAGSLRCVVPADMSERQMLDGFATLRSTGSRLLQGSEVEIDLQERHFSPALLSKIWKNFIEPCGCTVKNWIVGDEESRILLDRMGFKTTAAPEITAEKTSPADRRGERQAGELLPAVVHFGTLRGGQNIGHAGDVIILGNVNQGAEVAARGNVTVIGRLNGLVHAGCEGSDEMIVVTRSLEAGQVRIGTKVGIIDRASVFWGKPVSITIEKEEVQVIPWPAL